MKVCLRCDKKFDNVNWECPFCRNKPAEIDGFLSFSPELAKSNIGFKTSSFQKLVNLEPKNFWFRVRNRLIVWVLRKYFPNANKFLEIGCGTGFVLSGIERECPYLSLSGSEINTVGLKYASERLNKTELFQMDARCIPFEDEFSVIGAFDLLEHIEEDGLVLKQMYKAVHQGGGIILTVPQHPFLWSCLDDYGLHVRRYKMHELRTKVQKAGFKVEKITSFVSLLLPIMFFSRFLKKKKISEEVDTMAELRISRTKNAFMESVLNLEVSLIRKGLSFFAGGSLLLVAHKDY